MATGSVEELAARLSSAEEQVSRLEERLRSYRELFEQLIDVVYRTDADGVLELISPSCESVFGYTPQQLVGQNVRDFYVDPSRRDALLQELATKGTVSNFEAQLRRKDGSLCWLSTNARARFGEDGAFAGVDGVARDASQLKEAEQALLHKNVDLKMAQRTANVGNWSLDPTVGVPVWSEEVHRIYERDPQLGPYALTDCRKVYEGESWETFSTAITRAINEGTPYDIVLQVHFPSGKTKWIHAICEPEPERGPQGHLLRGTIQDITERKLAEDALRNSEKKFRALFEQAGGYCMILDPNTPDGIPVIVDANDAACRAHGYPREEFLGRPVADIDDEEGKTLVRRRTAEIMKGEPFHVETMHVRKDGSRFPVSVNAKRIDIGDAPPLILTNEYDITEQEQAKAELEKQKTTFESLFESIPDAILLTDKERRITNVNRGFTELFGYAPHEVRGKPTSIIYESEEEFLRQGRERYNLTATQAAAPYLVTYRHKDGTKIPGETIGTKVVTPSGEVLGYFGLIRDISDRLKQEEALRQTQKMEAIGTLSGGIAHDFNNILAAILGYATLIKERMPKGSRSEEDIDEVLQASRRAKDLVSQILTFSRKADESKKALQMHLVVTEAMRLMRQTIASTIEIRQDLCSDYDSVLADPTQLHQVIMNLCTNAYQAMRGGEGVLSVTLATEAIDAETIKRRALDLLPGRYVRLGVSDTGVGMSPEVLARVCEPFFTTKPPGEGTGMGMAVVHGIVKRHGGGLALDSHPGQGTRIDVYLPHHASSTSPRRKPFISAPMGTERILVVDDEPVVAKLVDRVLSRLGYRVERMTVSTEALERFRQDPSAFDLVLTDQTMPGMSGATLANELMKIRSDLPVIICSGYSASMNEDDARALGVRALLAKPFEAALLARVVREVLDGQRTAEDEEGD